MMNLYALRHNCMVSKKQKLQVPFAMLIYIEIGKRTLKVLRQQFRAQNVNARYSACNLSDLPGASSAYSLPSSVYRQIQKFRTRIREAHCNEISISKVRHRLFGAPKLPVAHRGWRSQRPRANERGAPDSSYIAYSVHTRSFYLR